VRGHWALRSTAGSIALMGLLTFGVPLLLFAVGRTAKPAKPATMKEVLDTYEKQSADVIGRWNSLSDARWDGTLEFFGSQRPASPMAWSFLFDIVHHRGQITTYLRPMGSTVPQIYGPSGDEP
jgi:uncharacterized damage-inducible protein DinB